MCNILQFCGIKRALAVHQKRDPWSGVAGATPLALRAGNQARALAAVGHSRALGLRSIPDALAGRSAAQTTRFHSGWPLEELQMDGEVRLGVLADGRDELSSFDQHLVGIVVE